MRAGPYYVALNIGVTRIACAPWLGSVVVIIFHLSAVSAHLRLLACSGWPGLAVWLPGRPAAWLSTWLAWLAGLLPGKFDALLPA